MNTTEASSDDAAMANDDDSVVEDSDDEDSVVEDSDDEDMEDEDMEDEDMGPHIVITPFTNRRFEEDDEEWICRQDLIFGYGVMNASKTTERRAKAANMLVAQDTEGARHVFVPTTVQGVMHIRCWDEDGHVVLAEPMPLVFPSAAELAAVQTLGPRVSKSAAWIAVVQCKREEYVSNWTMLDTSFHLTVGALSKINVSPAQLCDELRAFEPSLQSKSTACALAHSPDAALRGLNLPPGARRAALQTLPGTPRAFYGQPYEEVITNHEAHNLLTDGDKLAEFNEWFGAAMTTDDVRTVARDMVAHHNRRWQLRHAHKFVKAKKCAPDADSIIKKLSDWGGGLDASGEDLIRNNMDAILADEPDPEWFTNVIRADANNFIFEDGCYEDVMLERDCIMDCPVRGQFLSGAFALAAAKVTGHMLPDEPLPLFRDCDEGQKAFAESWSRYRRDFLQHSRFGMELFVPSKRDNMKNQLFLHRRLPGSELSDQKAWKLFGGNVNFDAMADEVNRVSHELGFRLEQPARFLVVIEHREFDR